MKIHVVDFDEQLGERCQRVVSGVAVM